MVAGSPANIRIFDYFVLLVFYYFNTKNNCYFIDLLLYFFSTPIRFIFAETRTYNAQNTRRQ